MQSNLYTMPMLAKLLAIWANGAIAGKGNHFNNLSCDWCTICPLFSIKGSHYTLELKHIWPVGETKWIFLLTKASYLSKSWLQMTLLIDCYFAIQLNQWLLLAKNGECKLFKIVQPVSGSGQRNLASYFDLGSLLVDFIYIQDGRKVKQE